MREGIEHLVGGAHLAALFQERVVRVGDPSQVRHLFATQAGRAPPGSGGQADIGRLQAGASHAKEIAELFQPAIRLVNHAHQD